VAKAKVHIQGDPLAIEKPRFVAEKMAHLSTRRAAALQDSIRPMSQLGQLRNTQQEQMSSALPPRTDFSLVRPKVLRAPAKESCRD
jgi:hypothetical protein